MLVHEAPPRYEASSNSSDVSSPTVAAPACPIAGTELTATFGDDATLSGSSGCNTYTAAYTTDKGAIEIADVADTKKACSEPAGVMEQESSYLALLPRVASFRVDGPVLELIDVDRQRLVAFARTPSQPRSMPRRPKASTTNDDSGGRRRGDDQAFAASARRAALCARFAAW